MSDLLIMKKRVRVDASPVLFDEPVGEKSLPEHWQVRGGEWCVDGEWLTGANPLNAPGMITSRQTYFGNVLLEFEARTVLPSTHDIDCMFSGSWDEATNTRGVAYVVGLEGWWEGKVGIERSPEYLLNVATPLLNFEPGRTYRIQAGSVDGHVFAFIDGQLAIELTDPDPIDSTVHGLVGFEAYASKIQIRNVAVRQIVWEPREQTYAAEF